MKPVIRILLIPVGEPPREIEIEHGLKPLQQAIGGYIEHMPIVADSDGGGLDLMFDEEGKLKELPLNFWIGMPNGYLEPIVGPAMITAHDSEGETVSLTDVQLEQAKYLVSGLRREYGTGPGGSGAPAS